jgi:hypothetical protein
VVSGAVDPHSPSYQKDQSGLYRLFARQLPVAWRVGLAVSMISIFVAADNWLRPAAWEALLRSWDAPAAGAITLLLAVIGIAGTILAVLGVFGRPSAMLLAFPIGFDLASRGLQWENGVALVCVIFLMLLGTGIGSLWPVEERFFEERLGEKQNAK